MRIILIVVTASMFMNGACQNKIDDLSYIWENKGTTPFGLKTSIIEFYNDSIRVVNFPHNQAGLLTFESGKCLTARNTNDVTCTITKSVVFSMNTGQVISFCEGFSRTLKVIDVQLDSCKIKQPELQEANKGGLIEGFHSDFLTYGRISSETAKKNREWAYSLGNFTNIDERVDCRF